jgi:S1-C subfamily serine protease
MSSRRYPFRHMSNAPRLSRRARVWTTFAAGITGGLLIAKVPFPHPAPHSAIDKVAGSDTGAPVVDLSIPDAKPEGTTPAAKKGSMDPLPHLTPQEVARRALRWTASIRGDGVYGSGIVVDTRGYVLTNFHVIQGVEHIRVQFPDTEDMPATVVDQDKELDLALLKVELTRPVAAPPADFLDAQVGDDVFAVGCPRKMNFTVSKGMVSYVGRRIDGRYYVQSDLPTNDGNSGGPVVNDRGEVVGVMTFILRDSQGLAFAIPMDYAYERFADHLKADRIDVARFKHWRDDQDAATAQK